jgi:protein tyrosine phosphatase
MIWENKVKLIVMACPLMGPKKEEASCYWGCSNDEVGKCTTIMDQDIPVFELKLLDKT